MTKKNNGWISVDDRLPDMHPHDYYGELSDDILLYGIDDSGSNPRIFIGFMIKGNIFYSNEYGMCGHGNFFVQIQNGGNKYDEI